MGQKSDEANFSQSMHIKKEFEEENVDHNLKEITQEEAFVEIKPTEITVSEIGQGFKRECDIKIEEVQEENETCCNHIKKIKLEEDDEYGALQAIKEEPLDDETYSVNGEHSQNSAYVYPEHIVVKTEVDTDLPILIYSGDQEDIKSSADVECYNQAVNIECGDVKHLENSTDVVVKNEIKASSPSIKREDEIKLENFNQKVVEANADSPYPPIEGSEGKNSSDVKYFDVVEVKDEENDEEDFINSIILAEAKDKADIENPVQCTDTIIVEDEEYPWRLQKRNRIDYYKYVDNKGFIEKISKSEALSRPTKEGRLVSEVEITMFACTQCRFETITKGAIENHVRTHNLILFECKLCDKKYSSMSDMRRHLRVKHFSKQYKCSKCEYQTPLKSQLEYHSKIHYLEMKGKIRKCFKCDFQCQDTTIWKEHLKKHMVRKCKICNREYKTKYQYNLHLTFDHGESERQRYNAQLL